MSEFIVVGVIGALALWNYGYCLKGKLRAGNPNLRCKEKAIAALLLLPMAASHIALAQVSESLSSRTTPLAASSATVVPMLVRYDGTVAQSDSKPKSGTSPITFMVYKDEQGGEPLWTETQSVAFDQAGKYEVYLGSTRSSGLPSDLFGSGEARWLEVQVTGEPIGPRTLLVSVPYAMHAADAATLGGLPASAFMLARPQSAASSAVGIVTDASTSAVTTTGGTSGIVPVFTGASTIANSNLYYSTNGLGVGRSPTQMLDVYGNSVFRGFMQVSRTNDATPTVGSSSYPIQFNFQVYNTTNKIALNPFFTFQAESTGNNTATTGGTLNLTYYNGIGVAKGAETGLYFNTDGTIHFAPNQVFPSTSTNGTAVEGSSSTGTGVEGTSTSGAGVYGSSSTSTGIQGVSNSSTGVSGSSNTGNGVTGYTAATGANRAGVLGLAGTASGVGGIAGVWGDSSAHVGVLGTSLQFSGVEGITSQGTGVSGTSNSGSGVQGYTYGNTNNTAGILGQAGGGSGFSGIAGVWGDANAHVGIFGTSTQYAGVLGFSTNGPGVQGASTNSYAAQFTSSLGLATLYATNTASTGGSSLYGQSYGTNSVGVYGTSSGSGASGVQGVANAGNGVAGVSNQVGVHGIGGSSSVAYSQLGIPGPIAVWADITGVQNNISATGIVASAENNSAGYMSNDSAYTTLELHNYGGDNTIIDGSVFKVIEASSENGSCGFGGNGDMTCTGQVKSLATTGNGARTVETYSMQSPENWMEDFGSGTLTGGSAKVTLEAAFAEIVSGSADYHVFLTPRGDSKGLYVANTTATGFEVHESGGGTSSIGFDYRIVAKRKGLESQRMVDVTEAMNRVKAKNQARLEAHRLADANRVNMTPMLQSADAVAVK